MSGDRSIPPQRHAPHHDSCPAVGGDGGVYRELAKIHPKWKAWIRPGVCSCGAFYPPLPTPEPAP